MLRGLANREEMGQWKARGRVNASYNHVYVPEHVIWEEQYFVFRLKNKPCIRELVTCV
jgi:hypothetical protein